MDDLSFSFPSDLEAAITTRLKDQVKNVALIDTWPALPEDYDRLPIQQGAILIAYKGAAFQRVAMGEGKVCNPAFELVVIARNLRGPKGIYEILATTRFVLDGFQVLPEIDPQARLECVSEVYVSRTASTWIYAQTYELELEETSDE